MRVRIIACAALVASCGGKQPPAETAASEQAPDAHPSATSPASDPPSGSESKPVGTKLIRDVDASEKVFEIGENRGQGGLGKYSLRLDGKYIWPPRGEGCEPLVQCCTELSTAKPDLALICLLALGRDGACTTALRTTAEIAREQSLAVPASCAQR